MEELNGGERIYKKKQDRKVQATPEETVIEEIEDMETKVSNVTIDTTVTKKSSKKRRKTKRKKMTQPTQEEVVLNKKEAVVPGMAHNFPLKRFVATFCTLPADCQVGRVV